MNTRGKTIQQVDKRMRVLIIRIAQDSKELNELRVTRNQMVMGKRKVAPPPGVKVKFNPHNPGITHDDFDDLIPSGGPQ
jgi:hypothetical protein